MAAGSARFSAPARRAECDNYRATEAGSARRVPRDAAVPIATLARLNSMDAVTKSVFTREAANGELRTPTGLCRGCRFKRGPSGPRGCAPARDLARILSWFTETIASTAEREACGAARESQARRAQLRGGARGNRSVQAKLDQSPRSSISRGNPGGDRCAIRDDHRRPCGTLQHARQRNSLFYHAETLRGRSLSLRRGPGTPRTTSWSASKMSFS